MKQDFTAENYLNDERIPAGGFVSGRGFSIQWQDGPLAIRSVEDGEVLHRREPNGAFVETIIAAAQQRLEHYQTTRFECDENAEAIHHLKLAIEVLEHRTAKREERGVEGTHEV